MQLYLLLLVALFSHPLCASIQTAETIEAFDVPTDEAEIVDYFRSGTFNKTVEMLTHTAFAKIKALEQLPSNAAIIFDIDDTALSNFEFSERCKQSGEKFTTAFRQYVHEANAPAIPEVLEFYKKIVALDIKVIFLTYRHEKYAEYTAANLKSCGYTNYHGLILRSDAETSLSAADYKQACRKRVTQDGYAIIATIGDQASDFVGDNTGIKIKLPCYYASSN